MPEQYVIVKYLRLSLEDGDKEESDSIANQRNLLDYYIHQIFKDRSVEVIEITDDKKIACFSRNQTNKLCYG